VAHHGATSASLMAQISYGADDDDQRVTATTKAREAVRGGW
jgi:hypothetical protein